MIVKKFISQLHKIYNRKTLPNEDMFVETITNVNSVLSFEESSIRPKDIHGLCGGVIILKKDITTIIVSDLHARADFIKKLLEFKISKVTVLELLFQQKIQIVCVGDAFHSEGRAKKRWLLAHEEFKGGYQKHRHMDKEIVENLNLIELVFLLKIKFPEHFHFLKGNHENIQNENNEGNYTFGKFANEGYMVKTYLEQFLTADFINGIYSFEKNLPVLAVGNNFLISHGEPRQFHSIEDVINYYSSPKVIYDLTWTNDGDAELSSVDEMLKHYIPDNYLTSLYFAGHRPVKELYKLRANGKFVQFHNPIKKTIVIIKPELPINLEKDIVDLKVTKEI